jgi:UDP-2,3-diacylglucosamine pyrophosphatase LpxH
MQRILKMMSKGTMVYYLTGNHDEMLRKYSESSIGNFCLLDKLVLTLEGKKYWFFHGDVFDVTMKGSKILAKLGGKGYDMLIVLNRFANFVLEFFGREKISFSKKVKDSVKSAVKYISDFETTVAELAIKGKYDYAVCGHIHQPLIRTISMPKGEVTYMNSGDWIENLTALEYNKGQWKIFKYEEETAFKTKKATEDEEEETEVPIISILPDFQKMMNG